MDALQPKPVWDRQVLWDWSLIAVAGVIGLVSILLGDWPVSLVMVPIVILRAFDLSHVKRKIASGEYVQRPSEEIPRVLPDDAALTAMLRARRERRNRRPLN